MTKPNARLQAVADALEDTRAESISADLSKVRKEQSDDRSAVAGMVAELRERATDLADQRLAALGRIRTRRSRFAGLRTILDELDREAAQQEIEVVSAIQSAALAQALTDSTLTLANVGRSSV